MNCVNDEVPEISSIFQDLVNAKQSLQGAQLLKEEELKKDPGVVKDPILLEEALEQSRSEHIRKMVRYEKEG